MTLSELGKARGDLNIEIFALEVTFKILILKHAPGSCNPTKRNVFDLVEYLSP